MTMMSVNCCNTVISHLKALGFCRGFEWVYKRGAYIQGGGGEGGHMQKKMFWNEIKLL